jgi:hypothetical protein
MKGKPSAPEPCRQQTVRGPRPEGIPRRGASGPPGTWRLSDVYWMILDALSHHIPGQGRPPGLSGGLHPGVNGAACRGPPVVRERSGMVQALRPNRIPGPIGME